MVRSIDASEKVFYVITSLGLEDLSKVNCLVKGIVELPKQFIEKQVIVRSFNCFSHVNSKFQF